MNKLIKYTAAAAAVRSFVERMDHGVLYNSYYTGLYGWTVTAATEIAAAAATAALNAYSVIGLNIQFAERRRDGVA